jgi:hypothetical protein
MAIASNSSFAVSMAEFSGHPSLAAEMALTEIIFSSSPETKP